MRCGEWKPWAPRYALQTPWQGQHRHQHRISASLSLTTVRQSGARSPSSAGTTETPRRGESSPGREELSHTVPDRKAERAAQQCNATTFGLSSPSDLCAPFAFSSALQPGEPARILEWTAWAHPPAGELFWLSKTRRNPTYSLTGTVSARDTVLYFVGVGQPSVTSSLSNSAD
jgi:hypothetical protein